MARRLAQLIILLVSAFPESIRGQTYKTNVSPGGYGYVGCYSDNTQSRTIQTIYGTTGATDLETCAQVCVFYNHAYMGLEDGGQCFCGDSIQPPGQSIDESNCSDPCAGDSTEACGNANVLSVYSNDPNAQYYNGGSGGSGGTGSSSTTSSSTTSEKHHHTHRSKTPTKSKKHNHKHHSSASTTLSSSKSKKHHHKDHSSTSATLSIYPTVSKKHHHKHHSSASTKSKEHHHKHQSATLTTPKSKQHHHKHHSTATPKSQKHHHKHHSATLTNKKHHHKHHPTASAKSKKHHHHHHKHHPSSSVTTTTSASLPSFTFTYSNGSAPSGSTTNPTSTNGGGGGSSTAQPTVPIPPPAPTTDGTTSKCFAWTTVRSGEYCLIYQMQYDISFHKLQQLNPSINNLCSNLVVGYAYCVSGVAARIAGGGSTSVGSYPVSGTSRPTASPTRGGGGNGGGGESGSGGKGGSGGQGGQGGSSPSQTVDSYFTSAGHLCIRRTVLLDDMGHAVSTFPLPTGLAQPTIYAAM